MSNCKECKNHIKNSENHIRDKKYCKAERWQYQDETEIDCDDFGKKNNSKYLLYGILGIILMFLIAFVSVPILVDYYDTVTKFWR